ncbi:MAG: YqgE/AlgH family protein [Gammaproteobacteria bacterium]|nr:YqgE/AlgH family protein [Gammaproteobacteria bacterium]MCP5200482.1 YqgE/AlgH family protein [Gammaproteobacteria bacterium]
MNDFNLTNHFLIAMPTLEDPNFSRTVTYICAHNAEGAMGIVINRPLDLALGDVLEQMDLAAKDDAVAASPVFQGGPVHTDRGFILHRPAQAWNSNVSVTDDVGLATSRDILEAIAGGSGPADYLVALGYAGWGAGQLEQEMADNAWLSGPADPELIFATPVERRWAAAAQRIGVDIGALSRDVGHG